VIDAKAAREAILRFRRIRSLQIFAALYGSIHNHFNSERTLVIMQTFNDRRTAALRAVRAFLSVLDDLTIADITVNRGTLRRLLQIADDGTRDEAVQRSGAQYSR
jgi:hypothetical protein